MRGLGRRFDFEGGWGGGCSMWIGCRYAPWLGVESGENDVWDFAIVGFLDTLTLWTDWNRKVKGLRLYRG